MRTLLIVAALAGLAACGQPASTETSTTDAAAPAAAAAGALSESDAIARAEAAGYTDVVDLAPNPDGSWSATGAKDGAAVQITITEAGAEPTIPLQ